MSQMLAEIERIVNEDISNRINQYDVIYEAITNAVHANATKIICTFDTNDNLLQNTDSGEEIANNKINKITISDNGDGFTKDNYGSFCKYRSNFKMALGCKGVGRFVFLKVYNNAEYISKLKNEQEVRSFKFYPEFDTEDMKPQKAEVTENCTEVTLNILTPNYFNLEKI